MVMLYNIIAGYELELLVSKYAERNKENLLRGFGRVKKVSPNCTTDGNGGDPRFEQYRLTRLCDSCTREFTALNGPQRISLIAVTLSQQEAAGMRNIISG